MDLDTALNLLAREPNPPLDVAEVALLLARDEYPAVDVKAYLQLLLGMAHEVRDGLTGQNLQRDVQRLCRYLFHEMGFHGNTKNYHDPRNSYLNEVLERRTGIPITLSIVAMGVGTRAGLRIYGVGLPGHFIAKAVSDGKEVLFDPYHGGRIITPADCENLVRQVTGRRFNATPEQLRAAPLQTIVVRMLANLRANYQNADNDSRLLCVLTRLSQLQPDDHRLHRDLGFVLTRLGQPGKAIDLLQNYLEKEPAATDEEQVRDCLRRAKSEVARWN